MLTNIEITHEHTFCVGMKKLMSFLLLGHNILQPKNDQISLGFFIRTISFEVISWFKNNTFDCDKKREKKMKKSFWLKILNLELNSLDNFHSIKNGFRFWLRNNIFKYVFVFIMCK